MTISGLQLRKPASIGQESGSHQGMQYSLRKESFSDAQPLKGRLIFKD